MMKELQREVWDKTYRYQNESIEETWKRVASALASIEKDSKKWEEKFYNNLKDFRCTLGGRILSNVGTHFSGNSLLNCFVLGRRNSRKDKKHNEFLTGASPDSIAGIYGDLAEQALTLKSEGGWGTNFSHLRPRGTQIKGIGAETPGAVAFMELYDKSSEKITSGSGIERKHSNSKKKIRKGAMMGILEIWHPDILEFIKAKQIQGRLSKFNISVGVTDDFMNAVKNNDTWNLIFPDTAYEKYESEWDGNIRRWKAKGYPVIVYEQKQARDIWEMIMESTYNRNEPGIFFIDTANNLNNLHYCEDIIATNPCGEIPLPDGGVCLLGSINLVHFIKNNEDETVDWDWDALKEAVHNQIRMMDNVCDITYTPVPVQKENLLNKRRLGMGVLGYASALAMMKIPFNSEEALFMTEELMQFIVNYAYQASALIAKEKGSFPLFDKDKFLESKFVKTALWEETVDLIKKNGIRNSHLLAVAPTGNTSIYAGIVSGGLEPVFSWEYDRWVIQESSPNGMNVPRYWEGEFSETEHFKLGKMGDEDVLIGQDEWSDYMIDTNRGLIKKNTVRDFALEYMLERPEEFDEDPKTGHWMTSAFDLTVQDHIDSMKIFAKYIDQAISKTINVPADYEYEDFKKIYMQAWEAGIKGITTYRAGTMTAVLTAKEEKEKETFNGEEIIKESIKLPDNYSAKGTILRAEGKKWYVHTNFFPDSDRPFALFVSTNTHEPTVVVNNTIELLEKLARSKGIPDQWVEETLKKSKQQSGAIKIARMLSLCLRHGILMRNIVQTLDQVEDAGVTTFVFAIKKYIASFIRDGEPANGQCPDCNSTNLAFREGCKLCNDCGWTACA